MVSSVRIIREARPEDEKEWDLLVTHPLQSWAWGNFRKKMGIDVVRIATFESEKLTDAWQLTFHKIPHFPFTVGYFPKGPPPTKTMIKELKKIGKKKRAIFIQLEPNVTASKRSPIDDVKPSHHPLFTKYTFVLDLTKSEDELLATMHSKTRYNIRIAQKHGIVVREDNSPKAFRAYLALSKETTQRQGFFAHNEHYQNQMWDTLFKAGIAHLFTASYKSQILAAWIVFRWNNALYYPYGASSREHREVMAPTLLLWEIVRWAKHQGLTSFDLWGALGPNPNEHDPWYGFHRFKQGFSPQLVEFVGSYDLVIRTFFYHLYTLADVVRWRLLHLIP